MESFFVKCTPKTVATSIYNEIIFTHETGGKLYRYKIPKGLSISFINEVIYILGNYLADVDIIQLINGHIVIEWS